VSIFFRDGRTMLLLRCENSARVLCYSYEGIAWQSFVNVAMIALNSYICYWSILHWGQQPPSTIQVLDAFSALVLVVEVAVRMVSHGCRLRDFFVGHRNALDFLLMAITILVLLTFEVEPGPRGSKADRTELPVTTLRIVRDVSRVLRILHYLAHLRRSLVLITALGLGEDDESLPLNPDGLPGFRPSPTTGTAPSGSASWLSASDEGEGGGGGRRSTTSTAKDRADVYVPRPHGAEGAAH
jgi:hypothetical protein